MTNTQSPDTGYGQCWQPPDERQLIVWEEETGISIDILRKLSCYFKENFKRYLRERKEFKQDAGEYKKQGEVGYLYIQECVGFVFGEVPEGHKPFVIVGKVDGVDEVVAEFDSYEEARKVYEDAKPCNSSFGCRACERFNNEMIEKKSRKN